MGNSQYEGIGKVVKAGFWIYWSSIVNNITGFVYWLLITKIAGSEILGLTSATIGLSAIIVGFINLGVLAGAQRFLGREWRRSREEFNEYFWSTFYLRLILHILAGTVLLLLGIMGVGFSNYTPEMFKLTAVLVYIATFQIFGAYFTSILRTNVLFVSSLLGNITKLAVGIGLILLGYGFTGAVIGYIFVNLSMGVIGFYHIVRNFGVSFSMRLSRVVEVVKAGMATWIPGLITMLGMWVGVLAVFGSSGAVNTGYYYVAFALFSVVSMIGASIAQLLLPYLSGIDEGRERIASKVVSFTLVLVTPIVFLGILYGRVPLRLLGEEYVEATPILSVLLVSTIPLLIVSSITNLIYAIGDYRRVLFIGLFQNIPRLILYFIVVPLYHGLGAAVSFTIGSLASLPYSIVVGSGYGFKLDYRRLVMLLLIPGLASLIVYLLGLHWLIGSIIVLTAYLVYGRLGLVTRNDLKMIALSFVSEERLNAYYNKYRNLIDLILPE